MSQLAIKGHADRGEEVIEILEMLGGRNKYNLTGNDDCIYYVLEHGEIRFGEYMFGNEPYKFFTLEEFLEKYPYKVGDKVYLDNKLCTIIWMCWECDNIYYQVQEINGMFTKKVVADELKPYPYKEEKTFPSYMDYDITTTKEEETMEDKNMGEVSDGYHTFNELYEYRLLYNAGMFNEFAKQNLYDVHKSKLHSDGSIPFNDSNWFIVQAELPTGQISNHYEMKDWNLFEVPVKEKANTYDGHTPKDVAERLRKFLTPQPKYPKTFKECCDVVNASPYVKLAYNIADGQTYSYDVDNLYVYENLRQLRICRDAYWKIAGEQMRLDKPWKPNITDVVFTIMRIEGIVVSTGEMYGQSSILEFPTEEIRNAFHENFKELIEECKELL